jgi:cytoskeletal protein CcmA (bactofilin family)
MSQSHFSPNPDQNAVSTIGDDLIITGDVTSKGEIHVKGKILGDVQCIALVLDENGNLEGNVTADDVIVRGRLVGSVRAKRITLQANARVEGALHHESLSLEQGTFFEGESRPSDNRLTSDPLAPSSDQTDNKFIRRDVAKGFIKALPETQTV